MGGLGIAIVQQLLGHRAGRNDFPLWVLILMFLFSAVTWPRTVVLDTSGVFSVALFGTRRRFIPWSDVDRITSDWQETNLRWGLTSLLSRNGTRVDHTVFLRRQGRFLDDLRRYLPKEVFAPGIYEWHP
jgi:hypothetical protein